MTKKIVGSSSHQVIGKKKNFGAHPEEGKKNMQDFLPSEELTPEMKSRGFIVN